MTAALKFKEALNGVWSRLSSQSHKNAEVRKTNKNVLFIQTFFFSQCLNKNSH